MREGEPGEGKVGKGDGSRGQIFPLVISRPWQHCQQQNSTNMSQARKAPYNLGFSEVAADWHALCGQALPALENKWTPQSVQHAVIPLPLMIPHTAHD